MRITVVLGPFVCRPPAPSGAVEMVWTSIANELASRGHDVTLVSREPDPASQVGNGKYVDQFVRGFERTGYLAVDMALDLIYSRRALTSGIHCDVLVLNSFFSPLLVGLLRRRSFVCFYHLARYPKAQFMFYSSIDGILAVSQVVATALTAMVPRYSSRIRVVPNPIDTDVFRVTNDQCSDRSKAGETILYTGRIHPEKGLQILVDACSRLSRERPGLKLRLVGESGVAAGGGGAEFVASLRRAADETLELQMVAAIADRADLASELRSCSVYCYPSIAESGESFGVAPLEAMGVGCAVVVSSLDCFKSFVRPDDNALVFDHRSADPAARLADVLKRLLVEPGLSVRLGIAAAATATEFGISRIASLYEGVFEDFLKKAEAGGLRS